MRTAIVTGANGFVGKAVARELDARGFRVIALVRPNATRPDGLERAEIVEADLRAYAGLPELLRGCGAELFYHFAWAGTAGAARSDERLQLSNVQASCDAVRAAAAIGCRRFVFPSSIMQYEAEALLRMERSPGASAVYSAAKAAADAMSRITAETQGLEYVSGLISNIYGPGESSPRLVNSSIRKLLHGEHTAFSAGEQLYDFIYVEDAARAFVEIGVSGRAGAVYYIGNRAPRPLKDFLLELRDCVAPDAEIGLGELPFTGVSLSYREFDTEALYRDLGFVPRIGFSEGVRRTAAWIKRQEENP